MAQNTLHKTLRDLLPSLLEAGWKIHESPTRVMLQPANHAMAPISIRTGAIDVANVLNKIRAAGGVIPGDQDEPAVPVLPDVDQLDGEDQSWMALIDLLLEAPFNLSQTNAGLLAALGYGMSKSQEKKRDEPDEEVAAEYQRLNNELAERARQLDKEQRAKEALLAVRDEQHKVIDELREEIRAAKEEVRRWKKVFEEYRNLNESGR